MVGLAVVERGPRQLGDLGVREGFLHHPNALLLTMETHLNLAGVRPAYL